MYVQIADSRLHGCGGYIAEEVSRGSAPDLDLRCRREPSLTAGSFSAKKRRSLSAESARGGRRTTPRSTSARTKVTETEHNSCLRFLGEASAAADVLLTYQGRLYGEG